MARQDCQMWAGTVISIPDVHFSVSMWTWWRFVLMSFCQVWLLFKEHYVWISDPNKLPLLFPTSSLFSTRGRGNSNSILPSITQFLYENNSDEVVLVLEGSFSRGWCSGRLHAALLGTASMGLVLGSMGGDLGLLKGCEAASSCAIGVLWRI